MEQGNNVTRRQFVFMGTAACFAALSLAACGGSNANSGSSASSGSGSASSSAGSAGTSYKNGTYTGQSATLEDGVEGDGYGIITITIENNKIVDATFQAFEPDGTPKDKNYGRTSSRYAVAQKAISAGDDYTNELVKFGSIEDVDAISGATYLYDQFVGATKDALSQASAK